MENIDFTTGVIGLIVCVIVITLWKMIRFKFRSNNKPFDINFWIANNWVDYPIHLGVSIIFFLFEVDVLNTLNPLLGKWGILWEIPSPENKGFIFVMIPVFISLVLYPLFRKIFTKPLHEKVSPKTHSEHRSEETGNHPDPDKEEK